MPADEFLTVQRDIEDARVPRRTHPKGWEPGIDTAKGLLTHLSDAPAAPSDWSDIIRELGLDPTGWTVDENQPVQVRTWDSGDKRMYYYRATVVPCRDSVTDVDVEALIREVKRRKPQPPKHVLEERALVVLLADWQAGKSDHGGVEALVERLMALKDAVPKRVKEAAKAGRPISHLYVVGMGDMVEGCDGHYDQQTFSVALDRRQQVRLVRRILTDLLTEWSKLPARMVVGCVPGNHGEARRNGKSFTTFEDNDDLAVFEQVQEILGQNPDAYGHISFVIPDGDMTITLDVCGTVVSFAHGHQFSGSGLALNKARTWWKNKMASMHATGDARVLVYGHYHHLQVLQDGPRTIFGCPSNDGGSRWFEERGGPTTACGTLTFVVDKDGWRDLAIL
jgi:predicted phosphodiesterase